MLAERTTYVSASATMAVALAAQRLRKQGIDVIDLGAGEPDFPTPEHVKAAAMEAIGSDFTRYTPTAGISELKQAITNRYLEDYGVTYSESETIVTAGGKQALYNVALALFGRGDEVITPAPCWPTIFEQIKLAEATPVMVRTHPEDGFKLHIEDVLGAVTPRTRGIILNSPGNPTGALISEAELSEIADVAAKKDIWVVLDLCYERLIYDKVSHNLPKVLSDKLRNRSVLAGSASKAYAMTGWRCGWVLAPPEVVSACNAFQSHATSNVCSITQKAVVAALTGDQNCVTVMLDEFRRRRGTLLETLTSDPRIRCVKPSGAFYLFPDISGLLSSDGIRTSVDFAKELLEKGHVAVTAGEAFDAPGFVRISYATSMDLLEQGAARILEFAESYGAKETSNKAS